MIKEISTLCALTFGIVFSQASALAQSPFGHTFGCDQKPTDNFIAGRWGELYGQIKYTIGKANRPPSENAFRLERLAESVATAFGVKEGNFLLTLEAKVGGEVIATKPIISYSWKKRRYCSFRKKIS